MDKRDTISRFSRYISLIQTIVKYPVHTYSELAECWTGPGTLSQRTFSNLKKQLKEQFEIEITKGDDGTYVASKSKALEKTADLLQDFLLNCGEKILDDQEKQLVEKKVILNGSYGPKTKEYKTAVRAIAGKKQLEFNYRHRAKDPHSPMIPYTITPYGIKYYNTHWYVYGHVEQPKDTDRFDRFFILNESRMEDCRLSKQDAVIPLSIDMEASFRSYYGVITGDSNGEILPEDIVLKVYTARDKHKYYNETPIHISQQGPEIIFPEKDVKDLDNYYLYRYHVAPTYDFIQKLLSDREDVEVQSPQSLRQLMKDIIRQMAAHYED